MSAPSCAFCEDVNSTHAQDNHIYRYALHHEQLRTYRKNQTCDNDHGRHSTYHIQLRRSIIPDDLRRRRGAVYQSPGEEKLHRLHLLLSASFNLLLFNEMNDPSPLRSQTSSSPAVSFSLRSCRDFSICGSRSFPHGECLADGSILSWTDRESSRESRRNAWVIGSVIEAGRVSYPSSCSTRRLSRPTL